MTTHKHITPGRHAARRGNWLLGCGIVLVVVLLIVIGGIIFVSMNARSWAANGMEQGLTALIEEAPISEEEKSETLAVVDGFVQDFRDKDVSFQQLGKVMEELAKSPVLPAGIAMGMGEAYFREAELTDEEKADGRKQMARIAHGMADGLLDEQDLQRAVGPIKANAAEQDVVQFELPNKTVIRLKNPDSTTPEQLRAFIESARATADDKNVPAEPPPFDLSGELQKAIDIALGRRAPDEPASEPVTPPDTGDAAPEEPEDGP